MVHWNHSSYGTLLRNASRRCKLPCIRTTGTDISQIVTRVLLDKSNYTDSVTQSPYFAGIITGSMIWVTYAWVSRLMNRELLVLPGRICNRVDVTTIAETQSHPFTNLTLAITIGLCAYNFFRAISLDPGTCPKPSSDGELKSVSIMLSESSCSDADS